MMMNEQISELPKKMVEDKQPWLDTPKFAKKAMKQRFSTLLWVHNRELAGVFVAGTKRRFFTIHAVLVYGVIVSLLGNQGIYMIIKLPYD